MRDVQGDDLMVWVIGLCLILFLSIFLLFSKLQIQIDYSYNQDKRNDLLYVAFRVYHIQIYRKTLNVSDLIKMSYHRDDTNQNNFFLKRIHFMIQRIKVRFNHWAKQYKKMDHVFRKIRIRRFKWETDCGTGHAMTSGTTCGAIWAAKGAFLSFLRENIKDISQVHLKVNPHFQQKIMAMEMHCIVLVPIGKAILAFLHVRNSKKPTWQKGVDVDG